MKWLKQLFAVCLSLLLTTYPLIAYAALDTSLNAFYNLSDNTDATANGNTLSTTNGTVNFNTGLIGNAADFGTTPGNANALSRASGVAVDLSGPFSISLWINVSAGLATSYTWSLIDWGSTTGTSQEYYILLQKNGGNNAITIVNNGGGSVPIAATNISITQGTWHHIVLTQNASNGLKLYYDGSQINTGSQGSKSTRGTWVYLGNEQQLDIGVPGLIDLTGLWSKELTAAEVTQLYNSGAGLAYPFPSSGCAFCSALLSSPF